MQEYEITFLKELLSGDTETFSRIYSSKSDFNKMGNENVFKWISRSLNTNKSQNEKINACYVLQKMGENKQHKRKRRDCMKKLLKILEEGNHEERDACLDALLYFEKAFDLSKAITEHILHERDLSDKGFEVISRHEGKEVAKLLRIAYQYNDLIANWMK